MLTYDYSAFVLHSYKTPVTHSSRITYIHLQPFHSSSTTYHYKLENPPLHKRKPKYHTEPLKGVPSSTPLSKSSSSSSFNSVIIQQLPSTSNSTSIYSACQSNRIHYPDPRGGRGERGTIFLKHKNHHQMCRSVQWFWKCGCPKETVLDRCDQEFEKGHVLRTGFTRQSAMTCDACYYGVGVDDDVEIIVDKRGSGRGKGKEKGKGKGG